MPPLPLSLRSLRPVPAALSKLVRPRAPLQPSRPSTPLSALYLKEGKDAAVPKAVPLLTDMTEEAAMEPFDGYTRGLHRALVDRSKGPVYRELPLQERLMARRPQHCALCPGNVQTSLVVGLNELVETNVELLVRFVNSRGMIMPRKQTGVCAKHQRKLAKTIKRSRHLGFLAFTRGPDDFFNLGPQPFEEEYLEYGDRINPVHQVFKSGKIAEQQNTDPTIDRLGQSKPAWQIDPTAFASVPLVRDALYPEFQLSKDVSGQPLPNSDHLYRPPTFHLLRELLGGIKPKLRPKITWTDGKPQVEMVKPPFDPLANEPVPDAMEMFGPGEVYEDEAALLGKPMPQLTRRQMEISRLLKDAIQRARNNSPLAVPEQQSRPWLIEMQLQRERLEIAMEAQRVAKADNFEEDLDWRAIAADVQLNVSPIEFGFKTPTPLKTQTQKL